MSKPPSFSLAVRTRLSQSALQVTLLCTKSAVGPDALNRFAILVTLVNKSDSVTLLSKDFHRNLPFARGVNISKDDLSAVRVKQLGNRQPEPWPQISIRRDLVRLYMMV